MTSYIEEQKLRLDTLLNDLSVFRQQREANPFGSSCFGRRQLALRA
jgi:hypothetical protein